MNDPHLDDFAAFGIRYSQIPQDQGYFTACDARLFYASFGQGTPVVLLHGGMGNGTNWANQVRALVAAGYRPIVMDTRGHGRSSPGSRPFSYKLFCEDVEGLLDHLGLGAGILVGWSDGACTALELARSKPTRVLGVIFFACNVDPTGVRPFVMTGTIENCLKRHRLDFVQMTPTMESFEALQPKLEPIQKNEPNYTLADLKRIEVPVAVVQGEQDEFIHRRHAQYLAASLPNACLEILKGVGHFAPIQNPTMFNRVVLKHLRRFEGRTLVGRGS